MLRGRFGNTTLRPYLEGFLLIPKLKINCGISFLVDTGSDSTVLMPADSKRLGIDFSKLGKPVEAGGVGGPCKIYITPATVIFEESEKLIQYHTQLSICEEKPECMDLPSLLGRDILSQWRMNYSPTRRRLTFDVIYADETTPIPRKKKRK
jgi:hypothetical protein